MSEKVVCHRHPIPWRYCTTIARTVLLTFPYNYQYQVNRQHNCSGNYGNVLKKRTLEKVGRGETLHLETSSIPTPPLTRTRYLHFVYF